jgi:thiamine pyrophosphokinase
LTFIVAGSPIGEPPVGLAPGPGDRIIAADRGASHARAWGWPVHLLIGDIDSLPEQERAAVAAGGATIITAPPAKDETDLELALQHALAEGATRIVICAALGGRADHMLANVLLLARPELAGLDVALCQAGETIRLLRGGAELALIGESGDLLSLLPVGGDAQGITTGGLLYPLRNEHLALGQPRGISNVFQRDRVSVRLGAGLLLVIHTRRAFV